VNVTARSLHGDTVVIIVDIDVCTLRYGHPHAVGGWLLIHRRREAELCDVARRDRILGRAGEADTVPRNRPTRLGDRQWSAQRDVRPWVIDRLGASWWASRWGWRSASALDSALRSESV
jgi:hypothetical protein